MWIRLAGHHLAIAVGDDSPAPPILHAPDTAVPAVDRVGHLGVWLIARSAADWGYFPIVSGKVVWAVLRLSHRSTSRRTASVVTT